MKYKTIQDAHNDGWFLWDSPFPTAKIYYYRKGEVKTWEELLDIH